MAYLGIPYAKLAEVRSQKKFKEIVPRPGPTMVQAAAMVRERRRPAGDGSPHWFKLLVRGIGFGSQIIPKGFVKTLGYYLWAYC